MSHMPTVNIPSRKNRVALHAISVVASPFQQRGLTVIITFELVGSQA